MTNRLMLAILLTVSTTLVAEPDLRRPKALVPGDTIALVAPARPISDDTATTITIGLEKMGYKVVEAANLRTVNRYLAGTDEERAKALNDAWADPNVDALMCPAGGFGATRILDALDYTVIAQNPKILTGFSDITALHLAVYKETGQVVFHAPTSAYVLTGRNDLRPMATDSFWGTLTAASYSDGREGFLLPVDHENPATTIVGGVAQGRLIGGNLSLIHSLMGTRWEIESEGHILFLEEIRESPYRVDRMLSTLRLAGKLDNLAGVVVGQFARCEPSEGDDSFTVPELVEQYFGSRPYPVISNYPLGHVEKNLTLPIGALAELDADNGTLRLLENPVRLP